MNNNMNNNMNTGWITDRLPTREDSLDGWVFVTDGAHVRTRHYNLVFQGQPWQPMTIPTPYVKPKRWTVEWFDGYWVIREYGEFRGTLPCYKRDGEIVSISDEYAQQIEDIYNKAMT